MFEEDEDEFIGTLYDKGHWEWNYKTEELVFKSHVKPDEEPISATAVGAVEFKEMDLIEQQRFRKRYQRKTSDDDVVTLQDIKDVVLFTTPAKVLTPSIVKLIHAPMTDRFMRALILYCQYFLQITETMQSRIQEQQSKVRTDQSDATEKVFIENLEDLRLLVGKEYCSILMGAGDYRRFHHLGPSKKQRSSIIKDAILFETFLRFCVQIVWRVLSRKSLNLIQLEIHRIFKTDHFNVVERKLLNNREDNILGKERNILLGTCAPRDLKLKARSPLLHEVTCDRPIDYRLFGLGVVQYDFLTERGLYMENALIAPEAELLNLGVSVGILGHPRHLYDIMLKALPCSALTNSICSTHKHDPLESEIQAQGPSAVSHSKRISLSQKISKSSMSKKSGLVLPNRPSYSDIVLPPKQVQLDKVRESAFPSNILPGVPCDEVQLQKWMRRALAATKKQVRTKPVQPRS